MSSPATPSFEDFLSSQATAPAPAPPSFDEFLKQQPPPTEVSQPPAAPRGTEPSLASKAWNIAKQTFTTPLAQALNDALGKYGPAPGGHVTTLQEHYDNVLNALSDSEFGKTLVEPLKDVPGAEQLLGALAGVGRTVAGVGDFLTTPLGLGSSAAATVLPPAAQAATSAVYAGVNAPTAAEATKEAVRNPTPENVGKAAGALALVGAPEAIRAIPRLANLPEETIEQHNIEAERLVEAEREEGLKAQNPESAVVFPVKVGKQTWTVETAPGYEGQSGPTPYVVRNQAGKIVSGGTGNEVATFLTARGAQRADLPFAPPQGEGAPVASPPAIVQPGEAPPATPAVPAGVTLEQPAAPTVGQSFQREDGSTFTVTETTPDGKVRFEKQAPTGVVTKGTLPVGVFQKMAATSQPVQTGQPQGPEFKPEELQPVSESTPPDLVKSPAKTPPAGEALKGQEESASLEGISNSAIPDAKTLSDLTDTKSFSEHGLSGLNVPTQRVVLSGVVAALHDPQIRNVVVQSVPVDVVDYLSSLEPSTKVVLHDKSVLVDPLSTNLEGTVSLRSDIADALVNGIKVFGQGSGKDIINQPSPAQKGVIQKTSEETPVLAGVPEEVPIVNAGNPGVELGTAPGGAPSGGQPAPAPEPAPVAGGLQRPGEAPGPSGAGEPEQPAGGVGAPVRRVTGSAPVPLTPEGVAQEQALAARSVRVPFDFVFTSPEQRAVQTAQFFGPNPSLAVSFDARRAGELEGQPAEDVKPQLAALMQNPDTPAPGVSPLSGEPGEPYRAFMDSNIKAVQTLEGSLRPGERALVVTHGGNLQLIDAWLKAGRPANFDPAPLAAEPYWSATGKMFRLEPNGLQEVANNSAPGLYFVEHGATNFNPPTAQSVGQPARPAPPTQPAGGLEAAPSSESSPAGPEFKPEELTPAERESHKFSSTQVGLPKDLADASRSFAATIPDSSLAEDDTADAARAKRGERGAAPMLSDLAQALKDRFGEEDAPKANYSGLGALESRFNPGGNLSQLERASKAAHTAAIRAASDRAQAMVILRQAIPQLKAALHGGDVSLDEFRLALIESRLQGLRERWDRLSREAGEMSDEELEKSAQGGMLDLLKGIAGKKDLPQDLAQTAAALYDAKDWPTLRDFLKETFAEAGASVTTAMEPEWFDAVRSDPHFADALKVYKNLVEQPVAENHSLNEGIFSDALGPLNTYYPLIPLDRQQPQGPGRRLPYHKPKNIANAFATGLADGYDPGVEALRDRIAAAVRANDKAALINSLESSGLLRKLGKNEPTPEAFTYRGEDYEPQKIELTPSRMLVQNGQVTPLGATFGIMPKWAYHELQPILERQPSSNPTVVDKFIKALNTITLTGVAEPVFHASNLLGTLIANTPFLEDSLGGKVTAAPFIKKFAAIYQIAKADPGTEEAAKDLIDMAKLGLIPERYGSVTFSKKAAEELGAERRRFSLSPLLFGPKGIDIRARLVMYRLAKAINPEAKPQEIYHFVNQLGNYVPALQSEMERSMKRTGFAPFITAGTTMLRNGLNAWTGQGPMPKSGVSLRLWQQLTGGGLFMLALWAWLYKESTGKYPWEDAKAKLMQIPVPDKVRYSKLGQLYWGPGKGVGYVNLGFFNPLVTRGARAAGLPGAFQTHNLHGTFGQQVEAAQSDMMNAWSEPFMGPPAKAAFVGITGDEPYVTGLRDSRTGQVGLQLFPAIPSKTKPGLPALGQRAFAAARQINSFYGSGLEGLGQATGMLNEDYGSRGNQLVKMLIDYSFPGLFGNASNPFAKEKMIRQQQRALR